MTLSIVIITFNEEANLRRTLQSVKDLVPEGKGEIIIVDSGSTDDTLNVAQSFGAKIFVEPWKGFAAQKNSAIDKASGDWILSLDADEEVSRELCQELSKKLNSRDLPRSREWCLTLERGLYSTEAVRKFLDNRVCAYEIPRKNLFLGRWMKGGGFYPDAKVRFFAFGLGRYEERPVHEVIKTEGRVGRLENSLIHHAYPTLSSYIEHMNRYSSLGAEIAAHKNTKFSLMNIVLRPAATFFYNYFLRLGFLDGREGLLQHLYHAMYVSWKYAKAWEISHSQSK